MASQVTLQAKGLVVSPNQLDAPSGSLAVASNVIIKRENVIESRRGYKLYGEALGTSSDRAKQLMTYKGRILRHFASTLEFDTELDDNSGQSIFDAFNGSYSEPLSGRRIRSIESNGNLYFTSDTGIKKISATSASEFSTASGYITQAGGIKALDLQARLAITLGQQTGFLPQDSAVAYRIVWGVTDTNKNQILGVPSQSVTIFNPLLNLLLQDFDRLLQALDNVSNNGGANASLIDDGDYIDDLELAIDASANDLLTNLEALAEKIDTDLLYCDGSGGTPLLLGVTSSVDVSSNICTITFSSGDPTDYFTSGSEIYCAGFTAGAAVINGAQTISSVTSSTIVFNITTANFTVNNPVNGQIFSNEYRSITAPSSPSIPPTNTQLVDIQSYLQDILSQLQSEPDAGTPPTISLNSQTTFISPLDTTTTSNTILNFTIPQEVTVDNFYQVYRSDIFSASGTQVLSTDIFPNDELKLVFEGFPTSAELTAGFIEVEDITPPEFAGAFLYTNATTGDGEGIAGANEIPPFALDINRFKNVTFYSNTRTKFSQLINLLGITNMIEDYDNNDIPAITIASGTTSNTYYFVVGLPQIITVETVADVSSSLAGKYFEFSSITTDYYCYFIVDGVGADPLIAGKTAIPIYLTEDDADTVVAEKTGNGISALISDFTVSVLGNDITITNVEDGPATAPGDGDSGFTTAISQDGKGEDVSANEILLSSSDSPAQAVDETARSLVHVINSNPNEIIYAFYLSGPVDVPGQMQFEARDLTEDPFYVLANNANTGASFNPDITPQVTIDDISIANPTVITTLTPHGLVNMDQVVICNSDSTPSIDGLHTITYIDSTSFSLDIDVTVGGTQGALSIASATLTADNLIRPNRVYYSKFLQPEAVPLLHYIDVGAQDKAILRIFPLRDSLFVFKEDGLYRISGETIPFSLALFDSSCILIAADSVDVSNNYIYGWTTQGIVRISESNPEILSRPIDVQILKLATSQYTNFPTATWGVGYESDNSYTVYTVEETTDEVATIGYRYSTLTNTWTTFDKSATCGIIDPVQDLQYLGAGDTNFLEQERKNFNRTDYADREVSKELQSGNYFFDELRLAVTSDLDVGDIVTQEQWMTVFNYNSLLEKLDTDAFLSPHDYVDTLEMVAGDDPRTEIDALIDKVANDPGRLAQAGATSAADYLVYQSITGSVNITNIAAGDETVITTSGSHGLQTGRIINIANSDSVPSIDGIHEVTVLSPTTFSIDFSVTQVGTTGDFSVENNDFRDIKASYNGLVTLLNADLGVQYSNYQMITNTTLQEAIVISINNTLKRVSLNAELDFIVGPLTFYKAIPTQVQWTSETMGDPLSLKHVREATMMFQNKAFTDAILSFSSDLLPAFKEIPFNGNGPGLFGFDNFGYNFFGGTSNSAPFRTYIPRNSQRCRFINVRFEHATARETWAIYGITLTFEQTSVRAYR